MDRLIAVFGAGQGLGKAVAKRFGDEGYKVALIARSAKHLQNLKESLLIDGVEAYPFVADLTVEGSASNLVATIQETLGQIDVVYYAPSTTHAFMPAADVTSDVIRYVMELSLFSMIDIVHAVLPAMQERGSGAILSAVGGDLTIGTPYMSGFAVGHSAARNYLYSLNGELADQGINVGLVSISGIVKDSEYYKNYEGGVTDAPDFLEMPIIDPVEIAEGLWNAANGKTSVEIQFPAASAAVS